MAEQEGWDLQEADRVCAKDWEQGRTWPYEGPCGMAGAYRPCLGITGRETREIRIKIVMGVKYFYLQLKAMVSDLKTFWQENHMLIFVFLK